jgi:hypothetical protein
MGVGDLFDTNKYGPVVIKRIKNSKQVVVEFINTGSIAEFAAADIRRGQIRDRAAPSVFGVGFLGYGVHVSKINDKATQPYNCWHAMLERCFSKPYRKKHPQYIDYVICDEWLNFQNFSEWYEKNSPKKRDDFQVYFRDPSTKKYCPENTIFILRSDMQSKKMRL